MTQLTQRFVDAVDYARQAHAKQVRKGSNIPYIYHLLGVASLVLEHQGTESQAIAGLLHDVLEDCGGEHEVPIREKFGNEVIEIVLACTDGTAESKGKATTPEAKLADWRERKLTYLAQLVGKPDGTLLVSGCDKLHNARAILSDLEDPDVGMKVFDRFTAGLEGTLQYYEALSRLFDDRRSAVSRALSSTVDRIHAIVAASMLNPPPRQALQ